MSTAIEKVANYTPQELFLLSLLSGGAGFGGMRLLSDMSQKMSPIAPKSDQIQLDLPEEQKKPNMFHTTGVPKQADETNHSFLSPFMAVAGGLPLGFLGTKALYDRYQESQGNQEMELAKKKYQQQLMLAQQLNNKTAEVATPCVDSFCSAVAAELEKAGTDLNPMTYLFHKFPGMLGSAPPAVEGVRPSEVFNKMPSSLPPEMSEQVHDQGHAAAKNMINNVTGGGAGALADIWKLMALSGAAGMGGYMIKNHLDKRDREESSKYPSGVRYA